MKRFRKLLIVSLIAIASVSSFAQSGPKDVLKDIQTLRTDTYSKAREAKTRVDMSALNATVKQKALDAIKDMDASKIPAKDAYDWAQVYSIAEKHKDVCNLLHLYLSTNPAASERYDVQMLMMSSCNALGEGDMLETTLRDIKPTNAMQSTNLVYSTVYEYIDTVNKKRGTKEAIKTLDAVEKAMILEDPKALAQKRLDMMKANEAKNPPAVAPKPDAERLAQFETQAKDSNLGMHFLFVDAKADLLNDSGKRKDAIKTISDFVKTVDPSTPGVLRTANGSLTRLSIIDNTAPALKVERGYGDFPGLDKLKGKVVILDFFAHWCGPCIASFPDMRQLLADDKDKGLEVFGVTTYYKFYKQDRNLSPDDEFAKMKDFIAEENMTWPVVYADKSYSDAYGITGIPEAVIIDRAGKVHKVHVGYDKASFAAFRKEVEELLKK